jgi:hypothetical protein
MHLTSLPSEKIVDYGIGEEELTVDTVRFLLRGLGLKNAAIQKYYEPTMFKQLFKQTGQS